MEDREMNEATCILYTYIYTDTYIFECIDGMQTTVLHATTFPFNISATFAMQKH